MSASRHSSPTLSLVRLFGLSTITPDLPDRLRDLATDLEKLLDQRGPDDALLLDAPYLDQWMPVFQAGGVSLVGLISGHPTLRGPTFMTSPIWTIASDLTWVRSTSRFYRLGARKLPNDDTASEAGHVH